MEENTIAFARQYFVWLTRKAAWVVSAVAIMAVIAVYLLFPAPSFTASLSIDPSVERLLGDSNPDNLRYQSVRRLFGSDETIIVTVTGDSTGSMLSERSLKDITTLSDQLAKLPLVQNAVSVSTVETAVNRDEEIYFTTIAEALRDGLIATDWLSSHALFRDQLISSDGSVLVIALSFKGASDEDFISGPILSELERVLAPYREKYDIAVSGSPVVKAATAQTLFRQLSKIIPAILAILAILLAVVFRSVLGVVLPLATIFCTLLFTMAGLAAAGISLNMVTTLVPPLVITLGLAYCSHILSDYFATFTDEIKFDRTEDRVIHVLTAISLPQIITGVTTAAGFLALAFSPLVAVKEFAVIAALSVSLAVVLSLSFLPACLVVWPSGTRSYTPSASDLFTRFSRALANFDIKYRNPILGLGIAALILASYGSTMIKVGSEYIKDFPENATVRTDYEAVQSQLGGANNFYIVIEGHLEDSFTTPRSLAAIEKLQEWLAEQPEISGSTSLVDHIKELNRVLNDGDPMSYAVPNDRILTKQLMVYTGGEMLERYVDHEFKTTLINARANVDDTASVAALISRIEERLATLPSPLSGFVTGSTVLASRTVDDIASGQLVSIAAAMFIIYLILSFLFTSLRVGLMALLPNLIPVAIYFGLLGFTGVTLNPTTSLVACIVLGIAVDDTVHYLVRFNAEARGAADEGSGTRRALDGVIRPISFTSLTLVLGFLAMTTSEMHNHVQFGALAAFTLAVAWLVDVIFTPAMASRLKIVTLWDVLRLDLGHTPQHSIPLFEGLSLRQARTFALLANLQQVKAGGNIITKGDAASDIYVVIDGEIDVWVENDSGERLSLATMRRGATIGEVGYFNSQRTANVDAVSHVRLLRFDNDDLERMRTRRPYIAATLFRNLNLIQAQRLANTTEKLRVAGTA
jgi:predicted RND superfamily exporter protein